MFHFKLNKNFKIYTQRTEIFFIIKYFYTTIVAQKQLFFKIPLRLKKYNFFQQFILYIQISQFQSLFLRVI